jgi:hypothetical protein
MYGTNSKWVVTGILVAMLCIGCVVNAAAQLTVQIVIPPSDPFNTVVGDWVTFEAVAYQDGVELDSATVQWQWDFGDGTQSTDNPAYHFYAQTGAYATTATATVGDTSATATITGIVGLPTGLTVTITDPSPNEYPPPVDTDTTFHATAYMNGVALDDANVQWQWDFGDGTGSTDNPAVHAFVVAGTYVVEVTATVGQLTATATLPLQAGGAGQGGAGAQEAVVVEAPTAGAVVGGSYYNCAKGVYQHVMPATGTSSGISCCMWTTGTVSGSMLIGGCIDPGAQVHAGDVRTGQHSWLWDTTKHHNETVSVQFASDGYVIDMANQVRNYGGNNTITVQVKNLVVDGVAATPSGASSGPLGFFDPTDTNRATAGAAYTLTDADERDTSVTLSIYDLSGALVSTRPVETQRATKSGHAYTSATWDGKGTFQAHRAIGDSTMVDLPYMVLKPGPYSVVVDVSHIHPRLTNPGMWLTSVDEWNSNAPMIDNDSSKSATLSISGVSAAAAEQSDGSVTVTVGYSLTDTGGRRPSECDIFVYDPNFNQTGYVIADPALGSHSCQVPTTMKTGHNTLTGGRYYVIVLAKDSNGDAHDEKAFRNKWAIPVGVAIGTPRGDNWDNVWLGGAKARHKRLDSRPSASLAAEDQRTLADGTSYDAHTDVNPTATRVWRWMFDDTLLYINGHGAAGWLVLGGGGEGDIDDYIAAKHPVTHDPSDTEPTWRYISDMDLSHTVVAVFQGCHTAQEDTKYGYGCLPTQAIAQGALYVVAWSGRMFQDSGIWSGAFWGALAHAYVPSEVDGIPYSFDLARAEACAAEDAYLSQFQSQGQDYYCSCVSFAANTGAGGLAIRPAEGR